MGLDGEKVKMREVFQFVKECEQNNLIQKVSVIYLYEELFESSKPTELEDNFQIFSDYMNDQGLKLLDRAQHMICARLCKTIMKKLSESRDINFKYKIHSLFTSILPLNHRSSLNYSGKFSQQSEKIQIQTLEEVEKELENSGANNDTENVITPNQYKTYSNFWNLQKLIVNPKAICIGANSSEQLLFDDVNSEDEEMKEVTTTNTSCLKP